VPVKAHIILELVARVTIFPDQDQIEITLDFSGLSSMLATGLPEQKNKSRRFKPPDPLK
jgi:hypothetical protein